MSEGDLDLILRRLSVIERAVVNRKRFGRVAKDGVKKGKVRVEIGGDNDGKPLLTPWLRTGQHHGFANENIPFEEGQAVRVTGLDGDVTLAAVEPLSYTDHDPLPEDADPKKHTYRIREPRKKKQDQGGQQDQQDQSGQQDQGGDSGGGGGDMWSGGQQPKEYKPEELEKQKDDNEKDHYYRRDYNGHYQRKKKAKWLFGEPDPDDEQQQQQSQSGGGSKPAAAQQQQNETKGSGETGEQHWFEAGSASITVVDGKIRFKVGKNVVILDGKGLHTRVGDDSDTPEKPQPKKISEDKDDVDGKFQHQITKTQREIKAPSDGPTTLLDADKIKNKAGNVTITWNTSKTSTTGGRIEHEAKNIGKDHKHGQVQPGGGKTGDPDE